MTDDTAPTKTAYLARQLGELLGKNDKKLSVAESCTGGGVAHAITGVPGCSKWFEVGVVAYSNPIKSKLLGVEPQLIDRCGAVSEEVVTAMLKGVFAIGNADVALSISGIAGPGGAAPGKPIGTVCIGFGSPAVLRARTYRFVGDRHSVREQSVIQALKNLLEFCTEASM